MRSQLSLFEGTVNRDLTQHNKLITSRFRLGPVETRIFMSMLARINRNDTEFDYLSIPVSEVIPNLDGDSFKDLKEACERLTGFKVNLQKQNSDSFHFMVLIGECQYKKGEGHIYAKFYPEAKPYLLQLAGNFTRAELHTIMRLKNPHTVRIYWLLKMLYNTVKYRISYIELKNMLLGEQHNRQYALYADFKRRIIQTAKNELADTDCAFSFEEIKQGKAVVTIVFRLLNPQVEPILQSSLPDRLNDELVRLGINLKSIAQISQLIEQNTFDIGYVDYVIAIMKKKQGEGLIKVSLSGAIYEAIVNGHLHTEYLTQKKTTSILRSSVKMVHSVKSRRLYQSLNECRQEYEKKKADKTTDKPSFEAYLYALKSSFQLVEEQENNEAWLVSYH